MPTFDLELSHRCSLDEAKVCCEKTLAELTVRYKAYIGGHTVEWHGEEADFTLLIMAPAKIDVAGKITVMPATVTMKGEFALPLMLRGLPIGAMIADGIRKAWTEKCKTCPVAPGETKK